MITTCQFRRIGPSDASLIKFFFLHLTSFPNQMNRIPTNFSLSPIQHFLPPLETIPHQKKIIFLPEKLNLFRTRMIRQQNHLNLLSNHLNLEKNNLNQEKNSMILETIYLNQEKNDMNP